MCRYILLLKQNSLLYHESLADMKWGKKKKFGHPHQVLRTRSHFYKILKTLYSKLLIPSHETAELGHLLNLNLVLKNRIIIIFCVVFNHRPIFSTKWNS